MSTWLDSEVPGGLVKVILVSAREFLEEKSTCAARLSGKDVITHAGGPAQSRTGQKD